MIGLGSRLRRLGAGGRWFVLADGSGDTPGGVVWWAGVDNCFCFRRERPGVASDVVLATESIFEDAFPRIRRSIPVHSHCLDVRTRNDRWYLV